jgi:ubiquinone/menaquinone biosynthesis C-methylase UbiE
MTISKLEADQLGNPNRIFGKLVGFLWNRRNAALNDTVLGLLALQPSDRVLDIGFGGGYLLNRMSAVVTAGLLAGVDISTTLVASAEKRYQKAVRAGMLDLKCAAAEALPYPDSYFTKVCSVNSIFYWQNIQRGILEIKRVLALGGLVVLCFTCKASLEKKGFAKNIQLYEAVEIEHMLAGVGFQDIKTASFSDRYRQYICITGKKSL